MVIERSNLGFALDGDLVEVTVKKNKPGERAEGVVTKVLQSAHRELIGNVKKGQENGQEIFYVQLDNSRLHIKPLLLNGSENDVDMKVVVEIESWKDSSLPPLSKIIETLGHAGDHETEMQAIIRTGGFSKAFPEAVQEAAHKLYENKAHIFAEAEKDPKRRDFRGVTTMTIDPHDAKDFDDALSFEIKKNGNVEVGIHIADVSHYVREGDVIDQEARERATSVYLVDRVIPMLPEVLSNDLCSLRPNEDRLAFSAVFELDKDARVQDSWYGQTIIHSDKRFSYEEAQEILDQDSGEYLTELKEMMRLSRLLRKKRYNNGAIAFESPEVKFELDESGKPIKAFTKVRTKP